MQFFIAVSGGRHEGTGGIYRSAVGTGDSSECDDPEQGKLECSKKVHGHDTDKERRRKETPTGRNTDYNSLVS